MTQDLQPQTKTTLNALACAAVLTAVMAAGVYQFISAVANPDGLEYPKGQKNFLEGHTTLALEKAIDKKIPARDALIAFANSIRYRLFGGGGDQVRVGQHDWLFLTDELKYEGLVGSPPKPADTAAALKARADLVAEVDRRLQASGVKLLVAVVPDKARLYAQKLPTGAYPAYNETRYANALSAFRARNVTVVDLLTPLASAAKSDEIYYRTDTHWNQKGAALVSQEIAKAIAKLGLNLDSTRFTSKTQPSAAERPGDLLRLMGLEKVSNFWRPAPDSEASQETIEATEGGEASGAKPGGGLFGEVSVPAVLTGTSYSLRGNFHGQLQQAASIKILNTAKDGGGFLQALGGYLKDDAFKSSKPKLLIWEIPERMLQSPLTDEIGWIEKSGLSASK
jgi:alginate O-acetyltransferase complex protein AlgJ